MVCELKKPVNEAERLRIEKTLRSRIAQEMQVTLGDVLLVKKGWVVMTHNRKMARSANCKKYKELMEKKAS
jgi:hypothetical protein